MKYEVYSDLHIDEDLSKFEFVSVGKNGPILKRITFIPTELQEVYILAFGDIGKNNEIDDHSISNNGDRNKILATVVNVIETYTNRFPERWIYFCGSTKERTRLYRMAVGLNLDELSKKFEIFAEMDNGEYVHFHKNMETSGFLIKRKIV